MYKKFDYNQIKLDFVLPFQGDLNPNNRWVILSNEIPWGKFEDEYASQFSENEGAEAKSFRVALGALIIQKKLGLTDEETAWQIMENPYLQYFIGFTEYQTKKPFHSSMLVHFRKRINSDLINRINDDFF